jgi:murein DD-endopeptidase MepM/ murein hydrolase activator NlpD
MKKNIYAAISLLMLASCVSQPAAPIEYGSSERRSSGASERTRGGGIAEDDGDGIKSRQLEGKKSAMSTGEMKEKDEPFTEYKEDSASDSEAKPMTQKESIKEENKLENDLTQEDKKLRTLEEEMDEIEAQQSDAAPAQGEAEIVKPDEVKIDDATQDSSADVIKFTMPVSGKIVTKFGDDNGGKRSNGIDISAARGAGVKSVADGKVVFAGNDPRFGNLIIVKVGSTDMFAAYAYMDDMLLQKDDSVTKGQVIGHVGSTGDAAGPQLHFALRKGKIPVDPMEYLIVGR